jgi:peptidoglycan/xylan/chitin deacetylase (PgdA/CDA1 family)
VGGVRRAVKRAVLHASKGLGLFRLARRLTAGGVRILCYHGVDDGDRAAFRPKLFITPARLRRRLAYLARHGFPVVSLDRAVEALASGTVPPCATVITFDDGFDGMRRLGLPVLRAFGFDATIYLTTYYCLKGRPVFGLLVEYALWRTDRQAVALDGLGLPRRGTASLQGRAEREALADEIVRWGEDRCDEAGRARLARLLCERLGVDHGGIERERVLGLVSPAEIREMALAGLDVQLHTHRHRFPEGRELALRELRDNRAALEPLVRKPLVHFCYPSGLRAPAHEPVLREAGIRSATTCEVGLNYPDTPRLALGRFLDGEDIAQIEFEAEMTGFAELLRRLRRAARRPRGSRARRAGRAREVTTA